MFCEIDCNHQKLLRFLVLLEEINLAYTMTLLIVAATSPDMLYLPLAYNLVQVLVSEGPAPTSFLGTGNL